MEHTPTPWRLFNGESVIAILDSSGSGQVPVINWQGFDDSSRPRSEHAANAAYIVQAVNAHEKLKQELAQWQQYANYCHSHALPGVQSFKVFVAALSAPSVQS